MTNLLSSIDVNPTAKAIGSIILLHGLGADGNDFAPIVPELNAMINLPLRFVFPHAPMLPVTINNGYVMRAWYDIVSLTIDNHADQAGIDSSIQKLHALIQREEAQGIPNDKIILAGFSQGAVIALTTGLTYPKRLGGIIALSGYLPNPNLIFQKASIANKTTPIFLGHGKEDTIVPYFLGESAFQQLEKNQYPAEWHSYRMPHSVCAEEMRDIATFLKKIYG